jgi:hypothetical protein
LADPGPARLDRQNLAARGREDVPDGVLFKDAATKAEANAFAGEWKRYGFGPAVVESKRWQRPLDRQSGRRAKKPPRQRRCFAICAAWTTSPPANFVGAY